MNTNVLLKCDICKSKINLRWQVGYFKETPVSIVCPECRSLIKILLITDNEEVTYSFQSKNAEEVHGFAPDYFAETSSELITFKISRQDQYRIGDTPFMRAVQIIGFKEFEEFHGCFTNGIRIYEEEYNYYERINNLFYNGKDEYLKSELEKQFECTFSVWNEEIRIRKMFQYNINFYNNFLKLNEFNSINKDILSIFSQIQSDKPDKFEEFLNDYCKNELIMSFEQKIRKSIDVLLENFNYFVPAMFLRYVDENNLDDLYNTYTITTTNFSDIKTLYITIYENVLNVYELFMALNNLIIRNDFRNISNAVLIRGSQVCNFNEFRRLSKGDIIKFIEIDEGVNKWMPSFNRKIRNAIGHEDWEYDPFESKVKIETEYIYLIEYLYAVWSMYPKLIAMYKILQDIKICKAKVSK